MQETKKVAKPLDPQRQYAQLLTLWAQGNKIVRRQTNGQPHAPSLAVWQLGQSMVSHGVQVLPVCLDPAIILVSPAQEDALWCVLVDREFGVHNPSLFRRMLWLDRDRTHALTVGPVWSVSMELARVLGVRQWITLCRWVTKDPGRAVLPTKTDAITVLAGLAHHPTRIGKAPVEDWLGLSRLWRHQGTWQVAPITHPDAYSWLAWDRASNKYLWPSSMTKDEDSVQ